jgi:hypothetical protein
MHIAGIPRYLYRALLRNVAAFSPRRRGGIPSQETIRLGPRGRAAAGRHARCDWTIGIVKQRWQNRQRPLDWAAIRLQA